MSFAVEAMVSASMASFIVEGETDSARGREVLEGCPKTSSSGIMPSLFSHVVELTQLKFRTL